MIFLVKCFLIIHIFVRTITSQPSKNIQCPNNWYTFETSCYVISTQPAGYRGSMDQCFKLNFFKEGQIEFLFKRPYLVSIESDSEMSFVQKLMSTQSIIGMYIGANNIVRKSSVLQWERLGSSVEVDKKYLCKNMEMNSSNLYCGYISSKKGSSENAAIKSIYSIDNFRKKNNRNKISKRDSDEFCINVSDCFSELPYMCEVNCTSQETKCSKWSKEYNMAQTDKLTSTTTKLIKPSVTKQLTTLFDPCAFTTHKCSSNSKCVFDSSQTQSYYCDCFDGFEGEYCERDERPCQPHKNKCINNSTCNQSGRLYNCTCPSGFDGLHCEYNIDDCPLDACKNGGQCEDLINSFKCICLSFFSGEYCEIKNEELVLKENVSRSFSVIAILTLILTFSFFITMDVVRFVFRIEPEGLKEQRQMMRKKKLLKKIKDDMSSKHKRKRYHRLLASNYKTRDPFVVKLEKTFRISYDLDLKFIDEEVYLELQNQSANPTETV